VLLSITTNRAPAADLGYLLHKNPYKAQSFSLNFGKAYVFYPEVSEQRCTASLLVDVDPVALVRSRRGPSGEGGLLDQYVNDRPYAASSFLSVALGDVYRSAMAGRSKDRPELVDTPIPLQANLPAVPARGGEKFVHALFEPLGYVVECARIPLDEARSDWGASHYVSIRLEATRPLKELLTHLYVLLPVLDDDKHYWVGDEEVDKLVRHGAGWLAQHPLKDQIARRYLKHQRSLATEALERLLAEDASGAEEKAEASAPGEPVTKREEREAGLEKALTLNERRLDAVVRNLVDLGAASVVDLGCGEGKLLAVLLKERSFTRVVGVDVSIRALEVARERLKVDRMPTAVRNKLELLHGSLTYRDKRLEGFDAACLIEVIEHLDRGRLSALERVVFEFARPRSVIVTTPNIEYNAKFPTLAHGQLRHPDHRFEWTRAEFAEWCSSMERRFGYAFRLDSIGHPDAALGAPTQMAVFTLGNA
jgi:3' terminal RNA ribose 2'-O-methyltransferase Hen1